MAIKLPEMRCALCGKPITREEPFRATGNFLPPGDPLTKFCNVPLHWSCYAAWPERPRFARHHVEAWVEANRRNPYWWQVHRDDNVYISANPTAPIEEASVRLYAFGSDIRVPLPRWGDWLRNMDQVTPHLTEPERQKLRELLPTLRKRYPDDHALVDAIDPREKAPRARQRTGS